MFNKKPNPIILIGLPVLAPLVFMLIGTGAALRLPAPVSAPTQIEEPRGYAPFPLPVTVTLPRGQGTISLTVGIAYQRGQASLLYAALTDRSDLLPMLVTQTVLTAAETLPPTALPAALPDALRDTFNAELAKLGHTPAVLEVFVTSWAAAW